MTKKDGYKHRHKWKKVSEIYGVPVKVCVKCEKGEN